MSKEDWRNGGQGDNGHTTRRNPFIRRLQSMSDHLRAERTTAHEQGHKAELCYPGEKGHLPQELEEGGLLGINGEYPEITHDVWLDTVAGENTIYRSATLGEEGDELPAEESSQVSPRV